MVVSNLLCIFAMNNRREKAKAKNQELNKQLMREGAKPIHKEKLIFEGGKFCLDMAKLILGGVVFDATRCKCLVAGIYRIRCSSGICGIWIYIDR